MLVLLVVIFGGLTAASLPLAVGGLAILGAFTMLRLLSLVTDVSIFAVNIVTMLGLGLAIDYALFVVSRFREEITAGQGHRGTRCARTMATAGRTVAFSGLTVAISLASLLFFPQVFLRSMGFGGMAAVLVAMVGALTVLPALLAVLGPAGRLAADPVPAPATLRPGRDVGAARRVVPPGPQRDAPAGRLRRGHRAAAAASLGCPFLRVEFGGVDHRALPEGTESRVVSEALLTDFPGGGTTTIDPVVTFADGTVSGADRPALDGVRRPAGARCPASGPPR